MSKKPSPEDLGWFKVAELARDFGWTERWAWIAILTANVPDRFGYVRGDLFYNAMIALEIPVGCSPLSPEGRAGAKAFQEHLDSKKSEHHDAQEITQCQ